MTTEKTASIKEVLITLMTNRFPTREETEFDALGALGIPLTGAALIAYALAKKCALGDVSAMKLLLEVIGETKPDGLGENALSKLSDAELISMMGGSEGGIGNRDFGRGGLRGAE